MSVFQRRRAGFIWGPVVVLGLLVVLFTAPLTAWLNGGWFAGMVVSLVGLLGACFDEWLVSEGVWL